MGIPPIPILLLQVLLLSLGGGLGPLLKMDSLDSS